MSDSKEPTTAMMMMMMRPEDDWGMRIFYHPHENAKLIDELCKNAYESAHKMWPQLPVKTRNFLGAPLLAEAPEYCKTLRSKNAAYHSQHSAQSTVPRRIREALRSKTMGDVHRLVASQVLCVRLGIKVE